MADACYVPEYLSASFKGVEWETVEASSEHGRRGAEGEFPFGEETAYADLGRKIRRFTMQGKFVRNNHISAASALIAAVESPGPGILVHPTRGVLMVACTSLKVSDRIEEEQGVTYVDLEFVEANEVGSGFSFGSSIFGLSMAGISIAVDATFTERYGKKIRFYRKNEINQTSADGLAVVKTEFAKAIRGTVDNKKWGVLAQIEASVNDPSSLAKADTTFEIISQSMLLLSTVSSGIKKYNSFKAVANWGAQSSTLPDEAGDAQNSIFAMFRILASGYMARAAMEVPTTTLQSALEQYNAVTAVLIQEMEAARVECNTNLHFELDKFLTSVKTALLDRAFLLPALVEYNFNRGVSSLSAAHEIFNDSKRFREIESRNPNYWPFGIGPIIVSTRV